MSDTPSSDPTLDTCGCCDEPADPPRDNRPGLPAIRWRPGTWSTIFARLKDALSTTAIADGPNRDTRPLTALTARADDDPAIAWLDACAVVGEILSFYQERIANEGFLRTATERRSVLELARQIGYELGPGVAASAALAFTLDAPLAQVPGLPTTTPSLVTLAVGTQVKSMPGPGQLPQTFETIEPLTARVAFNTLRPLAFQRHNVAIVDGVLYWIDPTSDAPANVVDALWVQGTASNVRPGDLLVVRITAAAISLFVTDVTPDFALGRTRLGLRTSVDAPPVFVLPPAMAAGPSIDPVPLDVEHVRALVIEREWTERDLATMIALQGWDPDALLRQVQASLDRDPPPYELWVFRNKTGIFGHNSPPSRPLQSLTGNPWNDWDSILVKIWNMSDGNSLWVDTFGADLFLDRVVDAVQEGQWVALATYKPHPRRYYYEALKKSAAHGEASRGGFRPPQPPTPVTELFLVDNVHEASLADFAIAAKATGIRLNRSITDPTDANGLLDDAARSARPYPMRWTSAWVNSEALAVAEAPITDVLWDTTRGQGVADILLDAMVLGLAIGQRIALTGTTANAVADAGWPGGWRAQSTGVEAREVVTLAEILHSRGRTRLVLSAPLEYAYVRATVTINANVAMATHGETVLREVLGNGDGAQKNQTFMLSKPPLTYVAAPTPSGGQSTIVVEVNGVKWHEVPSLYVAGPSDRVYVLRRDDDGKTSVTFGDGTHGARLPSGATNVIATYRVGTGPDGEVARDKLMLLSSRPLGLKSVTNPLAASGSAAPETLADAVRNAPRTVRTLDRVVSIDDYEDFTRSFLGIGKAQAVAIWSGQRRVVQLTVASATGKAVDPESSLYQNLARGIAAASDGGHAVYIDSFRPRFFRADVKLWLDPDYETQPVLDAVGAALRAAFAFDARDFAQPVTESEVIAVIQSIAGVVAVDVRQLYYDSATPSHQSLLTAEAAHWSGSQRLAAELLLLHPVGLTLEPVTA